MTGFLLAFVASFLISLAVETWPPSLAAFRAPPRALMFRLALHSALFLGAFSLSWRPWHAAFVTATVCGLFGAGSAIKRRILGEPLIFSDFALVRNAVRHPRLYYAERLAEPRALAGFAALIVATAAWFAVEPSILPSGGVILALGPALITALLVSALLSPAAARAAGPLVPNAPDPATEEARLGLGASMLAHWLVWRRRERPSPEARAAISALPAPRTARGGPPLIVAIQCESFVDVAARGLPGPELPCYRRLAGESLAWGRCEVPAEGAYTMRSEFAFLTGLPRSALGLDAYDPYLTAASYAEASLARRFAASGRRAVFMHPYDRRFFDRDALMPALGFERFVDGEAFARAERFGPYVADAAVGGAIAAEIKAAREPTFLFVVTMENHGPWGPGRIAGLPDPAQQYARHLENADRMIGRVAQALAERPGGGVLCVYGDHAPARTLHPDLPDRRASDYLLWDSRAASNRGAARQDLSIDALNRLMLA